MRRRLVLPTLAAAALPGHCHAAGWMATPCGSVNSCHASRQIQCCGSAKLGHTPGAEMIARGTVEQ